MSSDDGVSRPAASPEPQHQHLGKPPTSGLLTRVEVFTTKLPDYYVTPFCGALAGVASGIVTCPLDVIKTKLQAQGGFARRRAPTHTSQMYRGMIGTGSTIWRSEGIRGLYRGLGPMLLGYLPTWAVYLTVYDQSRAFFGQKTGSFNKKKKTNTQTSILTTLQTIGGSHEHMLL
jgi:solute carrier family 25 folate transporter 32